MNVYLVKDATNASGRILGVFRYLDDAEHLADALDDATIITERTLIFGQASIRGFNL